MSGERQVGWMDKSGNLHPLGDPSLPPEGCAAQVALVRAELPYATVTDDTLT